MRLLAAAILLLVVCAAPASAQTVRGELGGGPALAGDGVAWGEEGNGAVRILTGAPRRLVHRIAPATARRTERSFYGTPSIFDASGTTFAALTTTSTVVFAESDSVSVAGTLAAIGGRLGSPPGLLAGCFPARGDEGCGTTCSGPDGVAVDGDRIAVAETGGACDRPEERRAWITVHHPGGPMTIDAGHGAPRQDTHQVRLAGNYIGWVKWGEVQEIVVFDLVAGAVVIRLSERDLGARHVDELALQADGTVAFLYGGLRDRRGIRLGWTSPAQPGVRVIDRHAGYRDIALDGGRILYERILSERRFTGELVLRSLAGGPARRLAHFPERRRRVGDVDLDATRATWAVQPTRHGYEAPPRGPARIVVRSL